jgi:AraC family transcriptional regulator
MLRAPDARVLGVAVACGFKTQQHFAQVFRDVCGISPREYRHDFLGYEATCASPCSRLSAVFSVNNSDSATP